MAMFGSRGGLRRIVPVKQAQENNEKNKQVSLCPPESSCQDTLELSCEPFIDLRSLKNQDQEVTGSVVNNK